MEESPGSLLPSGSNGAAEDSVASVGPASSGQGPGGPAAGLNHQDSLRRCSQRKKSDVLLLGCASLLASVGLGQDLLHLGKVQVRKPQKNKQVEAALRGGREGKSQSCSTSGVILVMDRSHMISK